jgi:hypothetical protein
LLFVALAGAAANAADEMPNIRLYTVNSKGQQDQVSLAFGTGKPGCHNLLPARTIYRVAQVDFAYCTVYSAGDCAAGGAVAARWKGKEAPVEKLTPGARWMLPGEAGAKIASWNCAPKE